MILSPEQRKAVRAIQLDILDTVARICEEEGIEWFIMAGTLLGAVRHGGYIPWDDDIDIGMMRSEYDRFLKVAPTKLPEQYRLHTPYTKPQLPILYAKVAKEGTLFCSDVWVDVGASIGVCIDIFPYDYVSNDQRKRERQGAWGLWYDNMVVSASYPDFRILASDHGGIVGKLDKALSRFIYKHPRMRDVALRKHLAMATRYQDTDWVGLVSERTHNQVFDRREWVFPLGQVEFEGRMLPAPRDPDACLRANYGDYMQLPPEEERRGHDMDNVILGDEALDGTGSAGQ